MTKVRIELLHSVLPEQTEIPYTTPRASTIRLFCMCMYTCYVKRQVGLRGISLAVLALALKGWAVAVMLGVWGTRVAIARATEASDLKMTKVYINDMIPIVYRLHEICAFGLGVGSGFKNNPASISFAAEAPKLKAEMMLSNRGVYAEGRHAIRRVSGFGVKNMSGFMGRFVMLPFRPLADFP